MVCTMARRLADNETGFIGVGTGGRAFILAVGIPAVAAAVAQQLYAPRFHIMFGPIIDPDFSCSPRLNTERALIDWPSSAQIPVEDALGVFRRGRMSWGFISGAQIDKEGNVNILEISSGDRVVRLPGALAQPDHMAHAGRVVIFAKCDARVFVNRVDRVSGRGYLHGKRGFPEAIITDLGVIEWVSGSPRVVGVYDYADVPLIRDRIPWDNILENDVELIPPPTDEELKVIRTVDQGGLWLEAKMSGVPGTLD